MTRTNAPEPSAEASAETSAETSCSCWVTKNQFMFVLVLALVFLWLVYPKVMKNEIPKFVWSAAGVGYGIWTVSWFVAAFTSIRSGERAVKMIINSLYAAVCIVIWFWALKKYVDQNQTHFSMASFMLSALLSFVTIPY